MGNENLSKKQIQSLLHLAQFIQNYLMNRKGILKDDNRTGWVYQSMKSLADSISYYIAHTIFSFRKKHFERKLVS